MEAFQSGLHGLSVASHVVAELNSAVDRAPILLLLTVENNAQDWLRKHEYVPLRSAQHQVNI